MYIALEINPLDVLVSLKIFKIWRSLLERSRVAVFGAFSVLYNKMIDSKTKIFIEKLYTKNPNFIGKFEIKSNYTKSYEYLIIEDKYGELKIRASNLMSGCLPNIYSAVDKYSYRANQFKEIHGNTYLYLRDNTFPDNIRIECKVCDMTVKQSVDAHLSGKGCYRCGKKKSGKKQAMSYEDFIFYSKSNGNSNINFKNCNYTSLKYNVNLICLTHNENFTQTAMGCKDGMKGCPSCKRENLGFLRESFINSCRGKIALIYLLKIKNDNEEFYKIGITNRSVKKRFERKKEMPYEYEILYTRQNGDYPEYIFDTEVFILNKYNCYKYSPKITFAGHTECFNLSLPIDEIIENLKLL